MENNSEFGRGFSYCLGLFLAHAERAYTSEDYSMWFSGATDHLFELEIPLLFLESERKEILDFQEFCLSKRYHGATIEDYEKSIKQAKEILLLLDKRLNIPAIEADWK